MKKLLFILCLALFSCSSDDDVVEETEYFVITRDTCLTTPETVYTEYQVNEETYNRVDSTNWSNYSGPCPTVNFEDIEGESINGIYSGSGKR